MTFLSPLTPVSESSTLRYQKLFIVGCPRSGTTWLRKLLISHPDVLPAPRETHLYRLVYKPFTYVPGMGVVNRFQQRVWFFKHYGLLPTLLGASSEDVWRGVLRSYRIYEQAGQVGPHTIVEFEALKTLIQAIRQQPGPDTAQAKTLIATIFDRYFQKSGGKAHNLFLEKTPMHIDCVDVILNQFPEAKVIIVARDGRDVCASWKARAKTQKWARRPTEQLIRQWNRCAALSQKYLADPQINSRIRLVKYEDLRSQPETELESLLAFTNLSHTPAQVTAYVNDQDINKIKKRGEGQHVRKGSVGGWQQSLSESDIQLWNTQAKDALLQLGYSL